MFDYLLLLTKLYRLVFLIQLKSLLVHNSYRFFYPLDTVLYVHLKSNYICNEHNQSVYPTRFSVPY